MKLLKARTWSVICCIMLLLLTGIAQGTDLGDDACDWNQTLQKALKGVTHLKVVSGVIWVSKLEDGTEVVEKDRLLFEVSDLTDLESLIRCIEIDPKKSNGYCLCHGDPIFRFYKDNKLVAVVSYHHGVSLRWNGGKWPWDGILTDESRTRLFAWMDEHGESKPRQEYEKSLRQKKELKAERERRITSMPSSLTRFFEEDFRQDFKTSEIQEMDEALSKQYPKQSNRILALLEWYNPGGKSEHPYTNCESIAKKLLQFYSDLDILGTVVHSELSQNQLNGVVYYWKKNNDNEWQEKQISVGLRTKLLKRCLKLDSEYWRLEAVRMFGDFVYYHSERLEDSFIAITGYRGIKTEVVIPEAIGGVPVTIIKDYAFGFLYRDSWGRYCRTHYNSDLDEKIVSGAVCTNITQLFIPSSVTNIGYSAFNACRSLETISVDPANPSYTSMEGMLMNKDKTRLIRCPEQKKGEIFIPDSITKIERNAFKNCSHITKVVVPDHVGVIKASTFAGCSNLAQLTLPNQLELIECDAFKGSGLREILISNSITNIEARAFAECNGLTHILIPASVKNIDAPCGACTNLTCITVDAANSNYSSVDGILMNKEKSELIQYPAGRTGIVSIPEGTKSILWNSFEGCKNVTKITVPSGVTNIEAVAFLNCKKLTQVTLPASIKYLHHNVFEGCSELKSIYFLGNAPEMEEDAFIEIPATFYYLPNTSGWEEKIMGGRPVVLRKLQDR